MTNYKEDLRVSSCLNRASSGEDLVIETLKNSDFQLFFKHWRPKIEMGRILGAGEIDLVFFKKSRPSILLAVEAKARTYFNNDPVLQEWQIRRLKSSFLLLKRGLRGRLPPFKALLVCALVDLKKGRVEFLKIT